MYCSTAQQQRLRGLRGQAAPKAASPRRRQLDTLRCCLPTSRYTLLTTQPWLMHDPPHAQMPAACVQQMLRRAGPWLKVCGPSCALSCAEYPADEALADHRMACTCMQAVAAPARRPSELRRLPGQPSMPDVPAHDLNSHAKQIQPCHCKKSMCLKLYCDCFASGHTSCCSCNWSLNGTIGMQEGLLYKPYHCQTPEKVRPAATGDEASQPTT